MIIKYLIKAKLVNKNFKIILGLSLIKIKCFDETKLNFKLINNI